MLIVVVACFLLVYVAMKRMHQRNITAVRTLLFVEDSLITDRIEKLEKLNKLIANDPDNIDSFNKNKHEETIPDSFLKKYRKKEFKNVGFKLDNKCYTFLFLFAIILGGFLLAIVISQYMIQIVLHNQQNNDFYQRVVLDIMNYFSSAINVNLSNYSQPDLLSSLYISFVNSVGSIFTNMLKTIPESSSLSLLILKIFIGDFCNLNIIPFTDAQIKACIEEEARLGSTGLASLFSYFIDTTPHSPNFDSMAQEDLVIKGHLISHLYYRDPCPEWDLPYRRLHS